MSKRKRSIHFRIDESVTLEEEGSFAGSNKRVSFGLPETSDCLKNINKFKKKKIFKTVPPNSVIFGDIEFQFDTIDEINFAYNEVEFIILAGAVEESYELQLKICLLADKNTFTICHLNTDNDTLKASISDLLQKQYIWVMGNIRDIQKGMLNIIITTTPEKTPILKATNIINLFFGQTESLLNQALRKKSCTEMFYKELKEFQRTEFSLPEFDLHLEKLLPKLRPYQKKAVQWMLFREMENSKQQNIEWLSSVVVTYKSKCNRSVYYNKYSGVLALELCDFPNFPKGGILADEMGLGKTVCLISLILTHVRNINLETDDSNFLSAGSEKTEYNLVLKPNKLFETDSEIIKQNREDNLSPHEKLLHNKISKGPALRAALTEWYKSKLAEFSAGTPKIAKRMSNQRLKCICGNRSLKSSEACVQCPECALFQHVTCVGFQKKFLYYCPPCWKKQKLVKSKGTLIIAPTSIYHQWFDEIKKHVVPDGLTNGVFMYDGLKQSFVQPSFLSSHDIVITTYAILRGEVNHAIQNESDRKLRNEERFLKMCSPLRQIQWWRLCLDEAQMVENDFSLLNQMANLITSVNRWSLSGTPIQKSIQDLYYLIEWLGVNPFAVKPIWNDLLYLPYIHGNKTPLHSVISKIFWRNSKEDVADELMIPNQTVKYHFLKFTAIEQNFYMREHTISSAEFSENLRRLHLDVSQTVDSLDKNTLTRLLAPMLNLRQACLHPLAVRGNKISSKTKGMTLTELLQYLFNKTKVECEESMRKYIAALNGLAGIYCIEENWCKAVEHYRQVLQFTEEYKDKIQVDSLQRIHTLTNLAEVLQHHPEGIPPTLRDDFLLNDAKTLEEKYLQKTIGELESNENQLKELSNKVSNLEKKFESAHDVWWGRLIHMLTLNGFIEELLDKITTELITSEVESRKNVELFLQKISSVKGIEIMLQTWLHSIEGNRKKTLKHIENLKKTQYEDLVYQAVDCHLRTFAFETKTKKCQLCVCESVLLDYECALFDVSRKVLKQEYEKVLDGAQTKGSWRAQNAEKCLKVLLSVGKSKNVCESWCLQDGKNHIQMLDAMKKEFKQLRAVWMSINHQVQAYDEISMSKLRLRLRLPGEPIPPKITNLSLVEHNKVETIYIINHHEVEAQKFKLLGEIELSKSEFKKKFGTLLYLGNLGKKENPKPDPCPVCNVFLDSEWCVLQCGHSYCIDCVRILLDRSSKLALGCPVCREVTKSSDLSFVDLGGKQENSNINVVGDHSTKVDGIVRSLLELKKNEPKVKVLVFSTWKVVLKILEVAFSQNGISFRRMPGHNYQRHLKEFRDSNMGITALLLPISWGSKGLNLTEANHIFLVEPIMNPAEELQAIGRVHRIGQTKETVVHRFLIRRTIEEKIHGAVSEAKDKWGQKKVTLEDLKNLFDIKNDFVTSNIHD